MLSQSLVFCVVLSLFVFRGVRAAQSRCLFLEEFCFLCSVLSVCF